MAKPSTDPSLPSGPRPPDREFLAEDPSRFAVHVRDGRLHMEDVDLERLADVVGTPSYVYSHGYIEQRYRKLCAALDPARVGGGFRTSICYAVKANSNLAVLRTFARLGAGADIVSGGELERVLAAGFSADSVVFSGVAKSDQEIDAAIRAGVRSINIESEFEWHQVQSRAQALNIRARVSFRVNPDVDPATHPYLSTGIHGTKFGISVSDARRLALAAHESDAVDLVGLACHIGSQIVEPGPFVACVERMAALVIGLREVGVTLRQLDLGGGLGIVYGHGDKPLAVEAWGETLLRAVAGLGLDLVVEPGRYLVGNSGVLLTRVQGFKPVDTSGARTPAGETSPLEGFVIIDAAMNDLLRPALYSAQHLIVSTRDPLAGGALHRVDVVGPVCECGDFLARSRAMPLPQPGAVLAVLSAGAYGFVMSSHYNTRSLPAEVMVRGADHAVCRPRESVSELISRERVPDWA